MIEFKKTYLAKYIPEGLQNYDCAEVIDIYIPAESVHPKLRVRKMAVSMKLPKSSRCKAMTHLIKWNRRLR